MSTASNTNSSPRSDQPPSAKHQLNDVALLESSRRIPLTNSAKTAQRKLLWACLCSVFFMVAEVVGGYLAGSLAIMADAAHLLTDVAAFCISLFAIWMGTRPPTSQLSFGFRRTEVVGAVTSVLFIWVLTGVLVYAAVNRFVECLEPNPSEHVDGKLMFIVACLGLLVNVALMQILGHGHSHGSAHGHSHNGGGSHGHSHCHSEDTNQEYGCPEDHTEGELVDNEDAAHVSNKGNYHMFLPDHSHQGHAHDHVFDLEVGHNDEPAPSETKDVENLNIRSAYMHALADFIQSIGVCIAGALIWYKPEWQIADPIVTFVFSVLVLFTTVGIVRDSIHILMEGTPKDVNVVEIEEGLQACSSVMMSRRHFSKPNIISTPRDSHIIRSRLKKRRPGIATRD